MASDIAATLTRLSEKSRFLTERFKVVSRERDEALEHVADLRKKVSDYESRLQKMQSEIDYLKVSSVLAPTAETVNATRNVIKGMIADIDRCLADLRD